MLVKLTNNIPEKNPTAEMHMVEVSQRLQSVRFSDVFYVGRDGDAEGS